MKIWKKISAVFSAAILLACGCLLCACGTPPERASFEMVRLRRWNGLGDTSSSPVDQIVCLAEGARGVFHFESMYAYIPYDAAYYNEFGENAGKPLNVHFTWQKGKKSDLEVDYVKISYSVKDNKYCGYAVVKIYPWKHVNGATFWFSAEVLGAYYFGTEREKYIYVSPEYVEERMMRLIELDQAKEAV